MTTTDARALDAGRELDERVCVAFGVPGRVHYYASDNGGASGYLFSEYRREVEAFIEDSRNRMPDSGPGRSEACEVTHYPRVSEDMTAAMQVVEALRAEGWTVGMTSDLPTPDGPQWRVDLHRERTADRPGGVADGIAPTLPLAIVRAALAVMEGE